MTIERLHNLHDRRPFARFPMHIADGTTIVVKSPEFLRFGAAKARTVEVFNGDDNRLEYVDLLLMTKLTLEA